jgi:alpha-glucosidase (family GH31 glycosyl hydrolase)
MTMNMMGFTHSGVDVCGLIEEKDDMRFSMDEELCLRWLQLATFFPLARHSQDFSAANPYVTGPLGF